MKIKQLGLFGLGNQGNEHLIASQQTPGVHITAAFDSNNDLCARRRNEHPQLNVVDSAQALFNLPLDGYILALPHHVYEQDIPYQGKQTCFWQALMQCGKPILKEKPLARNMAEARRFIHDAREAEVYLQTAIQRRNHPSYKKLKEIIQPLDVLEVNLTMNLGFTRPEVANVEQNWRANRVNSGGGALLDCGYHMVDLALYLMGSFDLVAATTFANGKPCSSRQVDDAVQLTGRTSRTWLHINSRIFNEPDLASTTGYPKKEAVTAVTRQGVYYANRKGVWRGDSEQGEPLYLCEHDWMSSMVNQLQDFSHKDQAEPSINLIWEQQPAQQIIELAYQFSETWCGGADFGR